MTTEKVISPIEYKGKEAKTALFWKECYHEDEVTPEMLRNGKKWFTYWVKFDGLTPIMITKKKKM
ncbi:MAG: hypothetical protein ACOC1K_01605 [Nanoarchaeota archaeon]